MRQDTIIFSNGQTGELEMPDLYTYLAEAGIPPSPEVAAVLRLLEGTGALEQQSILQRFQGQREYWMGLYEIARLCLVRPRLVLKGVPGKGEIGPRDISLNDVQGIYWQFFLGTHPNVGARPAATNGAEPRGAPQPAPPGDDVPTAAQ